LALPGRPGGANRGRAEGAGRWEDRQRLTGDRRCLDADRWKFKVIQDLAFYIDCPGIISLEMRPVQDTANSSTGECFIDAAECCHLGSLSLACKCSLWLLTSVLSQVPTRGSHCRKARMSSSTCVCLMRLLIVILSLLVIVSRSNLIAGSSTPDCGSTGKY